MVEIRCGPTLKSNNVEPTTKEPPECSFDSPIDNLRIVQLRPLIPPQLLLDEIPITAEAKTTVIRAREEVVRIVNGSCPRLLVVVGPCSVHDPTSAREYASLLLPLARELRDALMVVMRVYFEKPRTTVGWKGLINDPGLDGSFNINCGLRLARSLLLQINELGLPVGCEYLDTITPQYTADLTSWAAIGARTVECQLHRELVSGLSMPVGFKNGTSGDVRVAADACLSAASPHCFLGVTKDGVPAIVHSTGNSDCLVILRGGTSGTNYHRENVEEAARFLSDRQLHPRLIVDCSHDNSNKDHRRQIVVIKDICEQIASGSPAIAGVMIESNIHEGNQQLPPQKPFDRKRLTKKGSGVLDVYKANCELWEQLRYGVSVTDKCIDWETTKECLTLLANAVRSARHIDTSESN